MNRLDDRKEEILAFLIGSYVENANPVGSKTLAHQLKLKLSSSTLRNEMGELEEMGYITHPHTSAGRIPTDKGYRYYVDQLLAEKPPESDVLRWLRKEYTSRFHNTEEIFGGTLKILSTFGHQPGLLFLSEGESFILKSISLVQVENNFLLAVWLSATGLTKSFLVDMGERLSEREIQQLNRFLNQELNGFSFQEIQDIVTSKFQARRDSLKIFYDRARQIIDEAVQEGSQEKVYCDGQMTMLSQPEFQDIEKVRPMLEALETKESIQRLLRSDLNKAGVTVRIGSETEDDWLRECSLISTPCRIGERKMGVIGVLGPRRMRYGQIINFVYQIPQMMSLSFERCFNV